MTEYVKPGQEVKFKKQFNSAHNGIIKAVWISNNGVLYQVAYFVQGKLEEPYIQREMFDIVDEEPIAAGFRLSTPTPPK
jgi:hypothetical protein